jgi:hypothetical protein
MVMLMDLEVKINKTMRMEGMTTSASMGTKKNATTTVTMAIVTPC